MKFTAILCVICIGFSAFVTHSLHVQDENLQRIVSIKELNLIKKVQQCRVWNYPDILVFGMLE